MNRGEKAFLLVAGTAIAALTIDAIVQISEGYRVQAQKNYNESMKLGVDPKVVRRLSRKELNRHYDTGRIRHYSRFEGPPDVPKLDRKGHYGGSGLFNGSYNIGLTQAKN
jgi:hypothetical protein